MAVSAPRLEISDQINDISIKIEGLEKDIRKRMSRIAILDSKLQNRVGLAQDVALARLDVVEDLLKVNLSASVLIQADRDLIRKMNGIREDYIADYQSLMEARSYVIKQGEEVFLTPGKKQQAQRRFCERLDTQMGDYIREYRLHQITNLAEEKERLKAEIEKRNAIIDRIFQEKTDQSLEAMMRAQPELVGLLKQRDELRGVRRVTNISMAAQVGDLNFIRKWLQSNNVNRRDDRGFTPAQYAAYNNQLPALNLLLEAGARNGYLDQSVYHDLADPEAPNEISKLARQAVSEQKNVGSTTLHWAVRGGSIRAAAALLNPDNNRVKGSDIETKGPYDRTSLNNAVYNGDRPMTTFLLDNGADINAVTNDNDHRKTPLYIAVERMDLAMVELLCEHFNLNPNLESVKGDSPLHRAIANLNQLRRGVEKEFEERLIKIILAILHHPAFHTPADANNDNSLESLIDFTQSIRVKRILERKKYGVARTPYKKTPKQNREKNEINPSSSRNLDLSDISRNTSMNRIQKTEHTIIEGTNGSYELWNQVNRAEAQKLFEETGTRTHFEHRKRKANLFVGEGNFGKTRIAFETTQGKIVAVKKSKGLREVEASKNERELHEKVSGEDNIIPLYDSIESQGTDGTPKLYHFMKFARFGNGCRILSDLLKHPESELRERILLQVALCVANGLNNAHKHDVYHFDTKPSNIVFDDDIYLIDFGCAQELKDGMLREIKNADRRYMPPERLELHEKVFQGEQVKPLSADKIDSWSLGVLLLEMSTGKNPFAVDPAERVLWSKDRYREEIQSLLQSCRGFRAMVPHSPLIPNIEGLLNFDPAKRLSVAHVIRNIKSQFANTAEFIEALRTLQRDDLDSDPSSDSDSLSDDNMDSPVRLNSFPQRLSDDNTTDADGNVDNDANYGTVGPVANRDEYDDRPAAAAVAADKSDVYIE